jgi:hypothetical protein
LIHATHNKAAPGLWLTAAAACGLATALGLTRRLDDTFGENP